MNKTARPFSILAASTTTAITTTTTTTIPPPTPTAFQRHMRRHQRHLRHLRPLWAGFTHGALLDEVDPGARDVDVDGEAEVVDEQHVLHEGDGGTQQEGDEHVEVDHVARAVQPPASQHPGITRVLETMHAGIRHTSRACEAMMTRVLCSCHAHFYGGVTRENASD